jgi:hypothetical protein
VPKSCEDCNGKGARSAVAGHCFDIDGGLWHGPGECHSCAPSCCPPCPTCGGRGTLSTPEELALRLVEAFWGDETNWIDLNGTYLTLDGQIGGVSDEIRGFINEMDQKWRNSPLGGG